MRLILRRGPSSGVSTIGELFVAGSAVERRLCWTLEDVVREIQGQPVSTWKVDGETAIPAGSYAIGITYSPRFGRLMPLLRGVPGFAGVRIHAGNTSQDTEGCILVGLDRSGDAILQSRAAFADVYSLIDGALLSGDSVSIEIVPAPAKEEGTDGSCPDTVHATQ